MGDVHFAVVDEAKQTLEFEEARVSQHDHRVLVRRHVLYSEGGQVRQRAKEGTSNRYQL